MGNIATGLLAGINAARLHRARRTHHAAHGPPCSARYAITSPTPT